MESHHISTTMQTPCAFCGRVRQAQKKPLRSWLAWGLTFFCIISFHLLTVSAQSATSCQENEALLEIKVAYQPREMDGHEYLDVSVQSPSLPTTESFSYYQRIFDNGTLVADNNITLCIPVDQCLLVVSKLFSSFPVYYEDYRYQLPPDEISIVYNGEVWTNKKGPLPYSVLGTMIVATVGPCGIVCEPEETLFQIEAVTGYTSDYDWQILDEATGQILHHCPSPYQNSSTCYWEAEHYYRDMLCLPRDGCYTLLVAERSSNSIPFDAKSLHVYFDGKHIESFEYLQFINIAVNNGVTACGTRSCDSDSMSVELYYFRQDMDTLDENRNLTWSLMTVHGEQLGGDVGKGVITSDDRAFYYHKECIPKVYSCIQLSTSMTDDAAWPDSIPLDSSNSTFLDYGGAYQENVTLRFAVDGIVYSDHSFEFGSSDYFDFNGTFEFVNYAGECSSSDICGNFIDFVLVQLDFSTGPAWQPAQVSVEMITISAYGWYSFASNLAPFYPSQKYRLFNCLPESWLLLNDQDPGSCTELAVSDQQFLDGKGLYSVSVDGYPFTNRQTTSIGMYYNTEGQVIRIGGQCQIGSSAAGPQVGMIIGCVLAALVVIIGGMVYFSNSKGEQQTQSIPPPSRSQPDTTAIAIPIIEEQYPTDAEKNQDLISQDFEDTYSPSEDTAGVNESEHEATA